MSDADSDTILKAQAQLQRAALALGKMSDDVADARTVKEFSHDRGKRALSVHVTAFLEQGESGVAAEHKARASAIYGSELHDLALQYKEAMRVLEKADGLRVIWESARSLLSTEKAKLGLL